MTICIYNLRGYNEAKQHYIKSLLSKISLLFLQEIWFSDGQLPVLADIKVIFCIVLFLVLISRRCYLAVHLAALPFYGALISMSL